MKLCTVILALVILNGISSKMMSQDAHLSHYWMTAGHLNPAIAGAIEEDYRATMIHRNQWSAVGLPFSNSLLTADMPLLRKRGTPNHFGIGVSILQSKAGSSKLKSIRGEIQVAWHQSIGLHNKLSTGITAAYVQRSINLDGLLWDSQYNGAGVDPSLPSGELFLNETRSYPDAGIGILWTHAAYHKFTVGYTAKHFFQFQGFLDSKDDQLILTQALHGEWSHELENLEITSNAMLQKQNASYEVLVGVRGGLTIGSDSRYTTNKTSSKMIAGLGYRWADAIIGSLGYEFKKSLLCYVSYDINSSTFNTSTNRKGAWEVTLSYTGWKDGQRRKLN